MRSLAYIHGINICHRDIKPTNVLIDPRCHLLKLCDFGSAKKLVKGEPNISYICSRYYRVNLNFLIFLNLFLNYGNIMKHFFFKKNLLIKFKYIDLYIF